MLPKNKAQNLFVPGQRFSRAFVIEAKRCCSSAAASFYSGMPDARGIEIAEGFAALGMWVDAWDALEELPPSARLHPDVLAVRLSIWAGLPRWGMGCEIARLVGPGSEAGIMEAARRFHLEHAKALCAAGDVHAARAVAAALVAVGPEGNEESNLAWARQPVPS